MKQEPKRFDHDPYPATKARQGEIILKTPARRAMFIAGLAAIVVLLAVVGWLA